LCTPDDTADNAELHSVPPIHRHIAACVLAMAPLAIAPRPVRAQRQMHDQWNSWWAFNADVTISGPWAFLADGSIRRSGPLHEAQANFIRGGLAYEFSPQLRAAVGANWSRTYPYGAVPIAYPATERRTWQQVVLSHDIGQLQMSHRYRLEQRFRGRRDDPDVDHIDHWERSNRFRYQVRGTLSLGGTTERPATYYLTAANEVFVSFGRYVQHNVFDQDRATVAVGCRIDAHWRTELGFLEQVAFKPNGVDVERNHTITLSLGYSR
jgi:hypothetical protein